MVERKTVRAHLGDIVTVYFGTTLTVDGSVDGVERLLQRMVNRELMEHQFLRAADTVKPALARQLPWLTTLDAPDLDGLDDEAKNTAAREWLQALMRVHGAVHTLTRLPEGVFEDIDPIVELRSMMQPGATIVTALATGYSIDTIQNPPPGMFKNAKLDDD